MSAQHVLWVCRASAVTMRPATCIGVRRTASTVISLPLSGTGGSARTTRISRLIEAHHMLAALIWGGMRQGASQGLSVKGQLDVLLLCGWLTEPPTGFGATTTGGLEPRQPTGKQVRHLSGVHSA